jgi:hypothetical protein
MAAVVHPPNPDFPSLLFPSLWTSLEGESE